MTVAYKNIKNEGEGNGGIHSIKEGPPTAWAYHNIAKRRFRVT